MLASFAHDHDGERLSCVSGGGDDSPGPGHDHAGDRDAAATVVLLHGAGLGNKERLLPLLEEFVARGCRGLALDFSGHGESSGELKDLSLRRRFEQAVSVIDASVPADSPLILVGFSMSGQTVADLAGHYGRRVVALGLCAPAVYGAEAWPVPFGEGAGRFSEIIRAPDSWRQAPALDVLRGYDGRAVLAVPGTDAVIPPAVTEAVTDALTARAQFTRLEFPDADHMLGLWLREHSAERARFVDSVLVGLGERGWTATRSWVAKQLPAGRSVRESTALRGGWSSQMRRLTLDDGTGLVLRSFVKPFYRRHAPGLLAREASVLTLLAPYEDVPTPELRAVDAAAEHCDHPSLLMSSLPGGVRVDEEDLDRRIDLLARQLARIHAVVPADRPRTYQAWTSPERVRTPRGALWERAVDVIRREPPAYEGCFLHRDFHPGNVLFGGAGDTLRISGVVDWVETSWGPADLDVAHCSTALALLHGEEYGLGFRARYEAHGGRRPADAESHLYWRLLDALAYSPDAEKLAVPWRELGRTDLTPELLGERLTAYVTGLFELYG
ncbi:phosphotransferase [Streptomyces sp. NBC_01340]|uniref:phosphotransferase n=1 Tax=unclassified Streptomyces TaxID=2593676 RepID=UPI0022559461|nr:MULTISPECIES: phosphotransferase [unclassified Streptomyces]MCX4592506.1 phosphotransferase [Streptomyces sp. NBC_01549]WSI38156.1 phosphotransferase [Streptomyces sp. NBC_01340]